MTSWQSGVAETSQTFHGSPMPKTPPGTRAAPAASKIFPPCGLLFSAAWSLAPPASNYHFLCLEPCHLPPAQCSQVPVGPTPSYCTLESLPWLPLACSDCFLPPGFLWPYRSMLLPVLLGNLLLHCIELLLRAWAT